MSIWRLACLRLSVKGVSSEAFLVILLLLSIVINSYCAYKFALEKGRFLAILAFVVAMVLDFLPSTKELIKSLIIQNNAYLCRG